LPATPLLEANSLTDFEQLFLFVRYPGRNDPVMFPRGFDVRAPFRSSPWVDFMLRVPASLRRGEGFYRAIATRMDPALFALPTKNCLGFPLGTPRWRIDLRRARFKAQRELAARLPWLPRGTNPKLNYADFERELRRPSALRALVEGSLQRLVERQVIDWFEPLELWSRHQRRRADHGDALTLLCSLELNLSVGEEPAAHA
jgi:hypothetical protein